MRACPLEGVKVLDLGRVVAAPYVGRILSDLGADVIRVESPLFADNASYFGVDPNGGPSGLYLQMNVGKRRIEVDLSTAAGRSGVLRLAVKADILIENFRPGVLARHGLGWPDLAQHNPQLVMLSITGFGQHGRESRRPAYAPVIHAESGLLARQGEMGGGTPVDMPFAAADYIAALHGTVAVLAALRMRDCGGSGQHIDLAMLDAMVASDDYIHYTLDAADCVRDARGTVYSTANGGILIGADGATIWKRLSEYYYLEDPAAPGADLNDKIRLRSKAIEEWFNLFERRDELGVALEQVGLAWGEVRTQQAVVDSSLLESRGMFCDLEGDLAPRRVVRTPYHFSSATCKVYSQGLSPPEDLKNTLLSWGA